MAARSSPSGSAHGLSTSPAPRRAGTRRPCLGACARDPEHDKAVARFVALQYRLHKGGRQRGPRVPASSTSARIAQYGREFNREGDRGEPQITGRSRKSRPGRCYHSARAQNEGRSERYSTLICVVDQTKLAHVGAPVAVSLWAGWRTQACRNGHPIVDDRRWAFHRRAEQGTRVYSLAGRQKGDAHGGPRIVRHRTHLWRARLRCPSPEPGAWR